MFKELIEYWIKNKMIIKGNNSFNLIFLSFSLNKDILSKIKFIKLIKDTPIWKGDLAYLLVLISSIFWIYSTSVSTKTSSIAFLPKILVILYANIKEGL